MTIQSGKREQVRVDNMGQAAVYDVVEKDGTIFWDDAKER